MAIKQPFPDTNTKNKHHASLYKGGIKLRKQPGHIKIEGICNHNTLVPRQTDKPPCEIEIILRGKLITINNQTNTNELYKNLDPTITIFCGNKPLPRNKQLLPYIQHNRQRLNTQTFPLLGGTQINKIIIHFSPSCISFFPNHTQTIKALDRPQIHKLKEIRQHIITYTLHQLTNIYRIDRRQSNIKIFTNFDLTSADNIKAQSKFNSWGFSFHNLHNQNQIPLVNKFKTIKIKTNKHAWKLNPRLLEHLVSKYNLPSPKIDLFADINNAICNKFVTEHANPFTDLHDAFKVIKIAWRHTLWANPPYINKTIHQLINSLRIHKQKIWLCLPEWFFTNNNQKRLAKQVTNMATHIFKLAPHKDIFFPQSNNYSSSFHECPWTTWILFIPNSLKQINDNTKIIQHINRNDITRITRHTTNKHNHEFKYDKQTKIRRR